MLYNSIERKFKSRQNPSMTTEVRSGHFGEGGWIGQKREGACWGAGNVLSSAAWWWLHVCKNSSDHALKICTFYM